MRRVMLLLSVVSLMAITAGCGGGSSSGSSGSSLVTISVGSNGSSASVTIEKNTFIARSVFNARKFLASAGSAFAAIPAGVTEIVFTVSGPEPDFQQQTKRVPVVSGGADITEQFVVPNGKGRYFLVEANDATHVTRYNGGNSVDLAGVPVSVIIEMTPLSNPSPSLGLTFSITPSEILIVETTSVLVTLLGTVTNNGDETLNGIVCSDSFGTVLSTLPTSMPPGASATIGGSYTPNPLTGPYGNTLTCSGIGAQSGVSVSQTMPASNNFNPFISFVGTGSGTAFCASGDGGIWVGGSIFSSGDESVSNVTCSAPELSTIYFYNITDISSISFLDILSNPVFFNSDYIVGTSPSVTVTCNGSGYFSGVAFSNATTLTCQ